MTSLNEELPRSLSNEDLSADDKGVYEKTQDRKEDQMNDISDTNTQRKMKRGSKGRVFKCTGYPDCNMSFTRSEHLARHKRKHTGERPFTCPHCSKNFSRLDNLRQHKQAVHPYETFPMNQMGTDQEMNHQVNPKTPNNAYFNNNQSIGNSLISPPNSQHSSYHQYPYSIPPHLAHLTILHHGSQYHSINSSQQQPQAQLKSQSESLIHSHQPLQLPASIIDNKKNEYKPKRRPRPLTLLHSFLNDNNSPKRIFQKINGDVLKSAPPVQYGQSLWPASSSSSSMQNTLVSYHPPNSAPLTPNGISPISPLYRQNFMHTNHGDPYYRGANLRVRSSVYQSISAANSPLPPVRNLPIPTNFSPYNRENNLPQSATSISSANSSNEVINNTEGGKNKEISKQSSNISATENRKSWLEGVLNDDSKNKSNNIKRIDLTTKDDNRKSDSKTYLTASSNKPTIDSLLSPCDADIFPNSVK